MPNLDTVIYSKFAFEFSMYKEYLTKTKFNVCHGIYNNTSHLISVFGNSDKVSDAVLMLVHESIHHAINMLGEHYYAQITREEDMVNSIMKHGKRIKNMTKIMRVEIDKFGKL